MKKLFLLVALVIPTTFLLTNCGSETKTETNKETVVVAKKLNSEILLDKIIENGDFINSAKAPTMIKSSAVKEAIEAGNHHVIDLRTSKDYANGHIKNAVNIKLSELLDYVNSIDMKSYKKVVLVCYTGQTASYANSVLQIMGYNNVYTMKWGMCSWNKDFSDRWQKNATNNLADKLSTEAGAKNAKASLANFDCKKTNPTDILSTRASLILKEGFKKGAISIDDIIASPGSYYIINYWPAKAYNMGHLEGAIQYTPKESLSSATDLSTLPTDKTIVVYCYTGQHSAFVTAYLRMLGYDAKSLKYGANSFMNTIMNENEDIGHGFNKSMINSYKFETSEYVEEGEVEEGGC
ncbi:MAG: rhodanese-like domain-containing protein [Bacteroidales bacterium]|nr:rhodanese-like domain-containing protein [Bacteroidales bacterium]